jgi:bacillithiol biosynthesis deacetylase BshB1
VPDLAADPTSPLDVLAIAAHPDDVELSIGGTMCVLQEQGYRTGIVDLTRGELGTRGTPETRAEEAAAAAEVLGLAFRRNLGLPDGDIRNTKAAQRPIVQAVRATRPRIVLVNAPEDRHPDHGDAARLATDALFASGLARLETVGSDGAPQAPWRPSHVLHYMNTLEFEPTFVVDVTAVWERRLAALHAFGTQFGAADGGPETFISTPAFLQFVEARARSFGYRIGATYGEPLLYRHGPIGIDDLVQTLGRERAVR